MPWDDAIVVSAGKLRKLWDSLSEMRCSVCERRLERTILRPAILPVKTLQFTRFFLQVWRLTIKTNKELDELIKHRNTINYVKAQRLSRFGHENRMPETGIVKKNTQMETILRKTSWKAQVSMGRWCQERSEEDEAYEVGRTSTGPP